MSRSPHSFLTVIDVIRLPADGDTLRATTPSLSSVLVPTSLVLFSLKAFHASCPHLVQSSARAEGRSAEDPADCRRGVAFVCRETEEERDDSSFRGGDHSAG